MKGETIAYYSQKIVQNCWKFITEHKTFGKSFIFRRKDYPSSLKKGTGELRKLLEVYEIYIPTENP